MITRIAPTPSGYLHLGNAANALLVSWLARPGAGEVILRIDDMDAPRSRAPYVEDIFDTLGWLGIPWTAGPRDAQEHRMRYSMRLRTEYYRAELALARDGGLEVYACACSRSQVRGPAIGGCPGGCRHADLDFVVGRTALRVHVPVEASPRVDDAPARLADLMGDFVVWRRDDLPAYQLVSVIEDRDAAVTHIVRGRDLLPSTAAQLFLAPYLRADALLEADIRHHELVKATSGEKLSKSQDGDGARLPRTDEARAVVHRTAEMLGAPLGITPPR